MSIEARELDYLEAIYDDCIKCGFSPDEAENFINMILEQELSKYDIDRAYEQSSLYEFYG